MLEMSPKYTNKQTTNKGVAWLYSEVCALLDVWADHDIQQQLAGRLHNMCVYDKISKRLLSLGIDRTGEQCREKIKKLKRDYKIVVENNYAPAFARKLLGCYDKVHEVFGKCAVVKPSSVIESLLLAEAQPNNNACPPPLIKKEIPERDENSAETSNDLATSFSLNSSHYDSDTESGNDCDENDDNDKMKNILRLHKEARKRKYSQSNIFDTLAKSQESLREKYLELERKRLKRQMDMEKNRLLLAEKRRQQERQQEYRLFKSFLSLLANKQHRDTALRLNGEDVVTYHFTHAGRD